MVGSSGHAPGEARGTPFSGVRGARTAADKPGSTQCACIRPDGSMRFKESWSEGQNDVLRERSLFLLHVRTRTNQMESVETTATFWNN